MIHLLEYCTTDQQRQCNTLFAELGASRKVWLKMGLDDAYIRKIKRTILARAAKHDRGEHTNIVPVDDKHKKTTRKGGSKWGGYHLPDARKLVLSRSLIHTFA